MRNKELLAGSSPLVDDVVVRSGEACKTYHAPLGVITGYPGPLLAVREGDDIRFFWGPDCAP